MNAPRTPLSSLDDALADLLGAVQPLSASENVAIFDADGRVLAADVVSLINVPALDNSSMDGYAVRCDDVAAGNTVLHVAQRIAAGAFGEPLAAGTAARIFTGAPLPQQADAIVMQEDCEALADGMVRIKAQPQPGQWIRRCGEDVTQGTVVLPRGTRLGPAELGLAASVGMASLPVLKRPRVALFSTGDELVMPGEVAPQDMRAGAIYNSNRFFLRAMLKRAGCEVTDLGIVPDRRDTTIEALREAAAGHDLILTSGGVSVGEEDHIKPAVQALGELRLWQIAIKPGKPFAYGRVNAAHFIGLPGNPVSSFVTCLVLVRPFLQRLQGMRAAPLTPTLLPAHFSWTRPDRRREFLRVRRNAAGGLDLFANQSSAVLTSAVWGDGVVDNPPGQTIADGDAVRFLSFAELLG